jgi:hypothetical protein
MQIIQTLKKNLMTYYKTYGIIAFKKHVNANHDIIVKKFEEKVNEKKNGETTSEEEA